MIIRQSERNCTISLSASQDEEKNWEIRRNNSLENDLVGGLMNYLTDPDILSPEDTLTVYLDTLKKYVHRRTWQLSEC